MNKQPITQWKRNCPKCGKELFYSRQGSYYKSQKNNSCCYSCRMIGNKFSCGKISWNKGKKFVIGPWKRNCIKCNKELIYLSKYQFERANRLNLLCNSCVKIGSKNRKGKCGYKHTSEFKEKLKMMNLGKRHTEEAKEKMRIAVAKNIQLYGRKSRNFNPNACSFIDNINSCMGWKLQHALNGGEIIVSGHFIDGYDKEKNIVFEYDEISHHRPSYTLKDSIKQKRIVDKINPSMFIRYDEKNTRLYDALTNIDILYN